MPIFARRQIQGMLDDLAPNLTSAKALDLIKRLESPISEQSIPAEYELALAWGISRFASLEIDRPCGANRPDIFSSDFFQSGPMVADVTALSDERNKVNDCMKRAANIINNTCSEYYKKSMKHLHYTFMAEGGYVGVDSEFKTSTGYFYRLKISDEFEMDREFQDELKEWLSNIPPKNNLRWTGPYIDVEITWRNSISPASNIYSHHMGEVYHIENNRLYRSLKEKEKQLKDAPADCLRVIFLGDAGSRLIWSIGFHSGLTAVSAEQIISHFLKRSKIDMVIVASPKRRYELFSADLASACHWKFFIFKKSEVTKNEMGRITALRNCLPVSYYEGYQATRRHKSKLSEAKSLGRSLSGHLHINCWGVKLSVSSRLLQEFLSGSIDHAEFLNRTTEGDNYFLKYLKDGLTISSVSFEKKGPEYDDDYVVFEFSPDPAASHFKLPEVPNGDGS